MFSGSNVPVWLWIAPDPHLSWSPYTWCHDIVEIVEDIEALEIQLGIQLQLLHKHLKLQNSQATCWFIPIHTSKHHLKKVATCLIPMTITSVILPTNDSKVSWWSHDGSQFIDGSGGCALHVTRATWLRGTALIMRSMEIDRSNQTHLDRNNDRSMMWTLMFIHVLWVQIAIRFLNLEYQYFINYLMILIIINNSHHHDYHNWLVVYLPLWKIWVRQMGWWTSQLNGKNKNHVPVTTNQIIYG